MGLADVLAGLGIGTRPTRVVDPRASIVNKPSKAASNFDAVSSGQDPTNPMSLSRVLGSVAERIASQEYGYTPEMQKIAASAYPALAPSSQMPPGAEGLFYPANGTVDLLAPNPSTAQHELFHAAWNKMTPDQQNQFINIYQKTATPTNRNLVNFWLDQPGLYSHQQQPTEIFAYTAQSPNQMSPELQKFYSKYMTNFQGQL